MNRVEDGWNSPERHGGPINYKIFNNSFQNILVDLLIIPHFAKIFQFNISQSTQIYLNLLQYNVCCFKASLDVYSMQSNQYQLPSSNKYSLPNRICSRVAASRILLFLHVVSERWLVSRLMVYVDEAEGSSLCLARASSIIVNSFLFTLPL